MLFASLTIVDSLCSLALGVRLARATGSVGVNRFGIALIAAISVGGTCGCAERPPKAASDALRLTGASAGPVTVGVTRVELGRAGRVVRDTVELGDEAIPESVAVVVVGSDTLRAILDSGRVYRIDVTTTHIRTSDTLGVGTTLRRLLREPGVHAFTGEGAVYVQVPRHCGLSFRLADAGELGDAPDSVGPTQLRQLPPTTPVSTVLVVGCGRAATVAPPT